MLAVPAVVKKSMSEQPLPLACVFSVEGETLTHAEKSLFSASQPFGFILFGRNCKSPAQLKKLTADLRKTVGWDCPIMIDQEGGKVARLTSPQWDVFQSARHYGEEMERDLNGGRLKLSRDMVEMAKMLFEHGIDVNCAPVLDVLTDETHDAIGSRAYSRDPQIVAEAADATCEAFLDIGVTPIIKHMPGHGRAKVDSHYDLPQVTASLEELARTDFAPFKRIASEPYAASVWAMMAHIIYTEIDPDRPASLSSKVINQVVREQIGFKGLIFSDDLDMKALDKYGSIADRAIESLQAGCDLALYCWAKIDVMEQLAAKLPPLSASAWNRWQDSINSNWAA